MNRLRGALILCLALHLPGLAGDKEQPEQPPAPPVPADAVEYNGHHYLVFDDVEKLSWDKGKAHCEQLGATLAVINDQAESDFITGLCDGRYLYLGASDAAEEGTWVWVDGSPWEFTNWMDGQPNDYNGNENYLATYDDGEWVDVDREGPGFWMPSGYICEWPR